jgi:hypothetical protein
MILKPAFNISFRSNPFAQIYSREKFWHEILTIEKLENLSKSMKFYVLTAASMNITELWDIVTCSVVEVDRVCKDAYCLHHQGSDAVFSEALY